MLPDDWDDPDGDNELLKSRRQDGRQGQAEYSEFIQGEKSIVIIESEWQSAMRLVNIPIRIAQIYSGFYAPPKREFNDEASKVLLAVSRDVNVMSHQVVTLLEMGADPNYHYGKDFESPIFWLARRGRLGPMKYLVRSGADLHMMNTRGRNVLMVACDTKRSEQVRMVRYLLQQKGILDRIERKDSGGNNALMNSIFNSNIWIVRELLLAEASVLEEGVHGICPYDAAKFIYAAGIGLAVDQLPQWLVEPDDIISKFLTPGRYDYACLVFFQSCFRYSSELVYRMVHWRKKQEERFGRKERLKPQPPPPTPKIEEDPIEAERRRDRERKIRKILDKRRQREVHELERWNKQREDIAKRIDSEYSKRLRGQQDTDLHEWVKAEKNKNGVAPWKSVPKMGQHIYTAVPKPKSVTIAPKIEIEQMLEQKYNLTHDGSQAIRSQYETPEETYKKKIGLVFDPVTKKWSIPVRTDIGFVDRRSTWGQLRSDTKKIILPESLTGDGEARQQNQSQLEWQLEEEKC